MLDVEAALARVQGRLGLIPAEAAAAISAAAAAVVLDTAELAASVRNVGYPVIAVVKALTRAAGAEADHHLREGHARAPRHRYHPALSHRVHAQEVAADPARRYA